VRKPILPGQGQNASPHHYTGGKHYLSEKNSEGGLTNPVKIQDIDRKFDMA